MSSSISSDPMKALSRDPALEVLSYMSPKDLGICSQVSKTWKELAADPRLWLVFFKNTNFNTNSSLNIKNHFSKISIKSFEDLYEKLKNFTIRLSPKRQFQFICSFLEKGCSIRVRIGDWIPTSKPKVFTKFVNRPITTEHYIFTQKLPELTSKEDAISDPFDMKKLLEDVQREKTQTKTTYETVGFLSKRFKVEIEASLPPGYPSQISVIKPLIESQIQAMETELPEESVVIAAKTEATD